MRAAACVLAVRDQAAAGSLPRSAVMSSLLMPRARSWRMWLRILRSRLIWVS